jgi:hypothetical protein
MRYGRRAIILAAQCAALIAPYSLCSADVQLARTTRFAIAARIGRLEDENSWEAILAYFIERFFLKKARI